MLNTRVLFWLEIVIILGLLLIDIVPDVDDVQFHGDEASRIASSASFEAFITGDINSHLWEEHYWTLTQPPLSRYFIGLGRTIGGYGPEDLNTTWNWMRSVERNIREGNMPSPGLLWWSRLPMALLTVVSGVALFYLLLAAAGRVAAYAGVLLFAMNAYLHDQLLRALGEAPLLTFVLLAAVASLVALRRLGEEGRVRSFLGWLALAGIMAGLAGAAKLNGLVAGVSVAALVPPVALRRPQSWGWGLRWRLALAGMALPLVLTALVFVLVNPYLYPAPFTRTEHMIEHRVTEMDNQFDSTEYRITNMRERLTIVSERLFDDYTALHFRGSALAYAALTLVGIAFAVWQTWRWVRDGEGNSAAAVLVVFGLITALPALLTPLDWERYYVLPVVFRVIAVALGVGWLTTRAMQAARSLSAASDAARPKGDAPLR